MLLHLTGFLSFFLLFFFVASTYYLQTMTTTTVNTTNEAINNPFVKTPAEGKQGTLL